MALAMLILAVEFSGDSWQAKSARDKFNALWERVTADPTPGSFPNPIKLLELFIESMDASFDTISDDLPYQGPFDLVRRSKLIHGVGVIAPIRWRSIGNHPYTGLFKGSDYGFARLSWAKSVDLKSAHPWLPGVAFKLLRDGQKSANFMAMTSLLGVNTPNFFANDVTNHVPDLSPNADGLILKLKGAFEKASKWPVFLGLSDMSRYDQNGSQTSQPVFPWRLIFHSPASVRSLLETSDKPTNLPEFFLPRVTKPIQAIWSVWAEAFPNDPNPIKIGEIDLTAPLAASQFSDKLMFFQHQRMEDDFALRQNWVADAVTQLEIQRQSDYYVYPNLSDN